MERTKPINPKSNCPLHLFMGKKQAHRNRSKSLSHLGRQILMPQTGKEIIHSNIQERPKTLLQSAQNKRKVARKPHWGLAGRIVRWDIRKREKLLADN